MRQGKRNQKCQLQKILKIIFFLSIQSLTAEYLVPNIGIAVWLLYIISLVYADAIHIVIIIIAVKNNLTAHSHQTL